MCKVVKREFLEDVVQLVPYGAYVERSVRELQRRSKCRQGESTHVSCYTCQSCCIFGGWDREPSAGPVEAAQGEAEGSRRVWRGGCRHLSCVVR